MISRYVFPILTNALKHGLLQRNLLRFKKVGEKKPNFAGYMARLNDKRDIKFRLLIHYELDVRPEIERIMLLKKVECIIYHNV